MPWSVRLWAVLMMLSLLTFGMSPAGVRQSFAGARDAPFWTETPSTQIPRVQVPNFADLAQQLDPAVVNISTTQVVKGQRRSMPRLPFPNPFGERDPFEEFFDRFFGGENPSASSADAAWAPGSSSTPRATS
jgi:S1-C subfamily serine protease